MSFMTIRKSVSYLHNRWYDGQRVDQVDMTIEQDRNVNRDGSIVQNHFGSGVVPASPTQNVVFDTENLFPDQVALIASNDFDGTGLRPLAQPSDSTLGNQLEVELSDSDPEKTIGPWMSTAGGRLSTKVLIIGLDFQGNLQYDRFYFYKKEKQVTKKHYARILSVFFNDFYGNDNCSRDLGGRIVIRETKTFQLSRDGIMIAQDQEPNLFFRDFKVSNTSIGSNPTITLYQTIQDGIGSEYNVDALHINTTVKRDVELVEGDITTRLAEKFLAKNNNIQKITILLGVRRDNVVPIENRYDWSGELIVSVYELQSSVSCPTELVPELAIEFDPNPVPLTQFSLDQIELKRRGYVLSDVLQPVDLIFNDTQLANTTNPVIVPGKHYAISIGRAGDAGTGTLFTGVGNSLVTDDRFSIFTGQWTDVPEEDLWYQVWSDTAKVADGLAYDEGNGMQINKTDTNELGAIVDYVFDQNAFADGGQNTLNTAIVEATTEYSVQEQDERTGNPVYARQQFEPSFSFVTNSTLATLRESSEPVIIGCARDTNPKTNENIDSMQDLPGLVKGNVFTVVDPEPDLISQQLVGSALVPNNDCAAREYKIVKVQLCTDGYGDVNGDGTIDDTDVFRATQLLGESLLSPVTQEKIRDGYIDTLEIIRADVNGDGYVGSDDIDLLVAYVSRASSLTVDSGSDEDDSYAVSKGVGSAVEAQAQEFTSETFAQTLTEAHFKLKIGAGTPTGSMVAELYQSDLGSPAIPTGSVLATSQEVSASLLSSEYAEFTFAFVDSYTLDPSTNYFIAIRHDDADSSNWVALRGSNIGTHPGNRATYSIGWAGWLAFANSDLWFIVKGAPVTSFPVGDTFKHLEITVQNPTGRFDGYYDCGDGYVRLDGYSVQNIVPAGSLSTTELEYYGYNGFPILENDDPVWTAVPFVPTPFQVRASPFWQDYLLQFRSDAREVPVTFSYDTEQDELITELGGCVQDDDEICSDVFVLGNCSPGRNDFYIPNNLIVGNGQILDRNGNFYKQDIEIHLVTLELPQVAFGRAVIDVYNKFLVNHIDGFTSAGYPAAKFADCTYVESDALERNQIRFGVAIQSITPNLDGYSELDGFGIIANDTIAVHIDQTTGLLYFTMQDIEYDAIYPELRTKIQITAYLKKAGWNNSPLTVPSDQIVGLLSANGPYPSS